MKNQLHSDTPATKVKGVFSCEEIQVMEAGAPMRKIRHKTYWFCQEQDSGNYTAQSIGSNHIPFGPIKKIARNEFLKRYVPEPAMYFSLVYPSMMELELTITRGDSYRNIKKYDRAEKEYNKALWIDEDNIRATFGLALTYLGMGDLEKANLVFERLVALDGAFLPEHKHLFNEFGIKLRKNGLYTQAITYYSRALELTEDDENLFFNLARVYFHYGDPGNSLEYTMKAVELNPGLEPAVKLLRWILVKKLVSAKKLERAAAFLALTVSSPFLEDEFDSFLEEEFGSFLDDHEELLLPPEASVPEMSPETPRPLAGEEKAVPGHDDAVTVQRIARLKEELALLMQTQIANEDRLPDAASKIPPPAETPNSPETPPEPSDSPDSGSGKASALHRKRRMSAVRAVRKTRKI